MRPDTSDEAIENVDRYGFPYRSIVLLRRIANASCGRFADECFLRTL